MNYLSQILKRDEAYISLKNGIKNNLSPLLCTGLPDTVKTVLAITATEDIGEKATVICSDFSSLNKVAENLFFFNKKVLVFPEPDLVFDGRIIKSKDYEIKRLDTLSKLCDGDFDVLIMTAASALSRTLPKSEIENKKFSLKPKDEISEADLMKKLDILGYRRADTVEGIGQYSVRGGIFDLFVPGFPDPVRIEFWGDEIDTVSLFDKETQRRYEQVGEITVTPVSEVPKTAEELLTTLENHLKTAKLNAAQKANVEADIERLKSGLDIAKDKYLPLIYKEKTSVLDYLDSVKFLFDAGNIYESLKAFRFREKEDLIKLIEDGILSFETSDISLTDAELFGRLTNKTVLAESFTTGNHFAEPKMIIPFSVKSLSAWSGDSKTLIEDLDFILKRKADAVVLAGEERAARILTENLNQDDIKADFVKAPTGEEKGITVTVGSLSSGYELLTLHFTLITIRRINGERRKKPQSKGKGIGSLDEIKRGDLVVHASHGIGVFEGISTITSSGVTKDYIKIKYRGSDVLYVPVTQLDLVSKYIGSENTRLNKLGSSEWNSTKRRVKKAAEDMAKKLTELYAKRMSVKGYAFSPDTDLSNDFERKFEFEETSDQLKCIDEIKGDMEKAAPMDRLLLGDVGFGKTEVALRAAFKCICEGKQCAFLVPTTILAWQHFNTAVRRMGDFPVNIKLLSRFVSKPEQKKTVAALKDGRADMVIGTHRIVSDDIEFHDLGLLIIDEEQRFSVAQKEKIKEKYPAVDVLTLSATPIPRTLNMSLSGLRDMSTIEEAPSDRYPVQTYVLEENNAVIFDAVRKELNRSGQVYYLHNRVETIERKAARLAEKFPDAKIGIAHGKMSEEDLSNIWRRMIEQDIDILVCTTIIETGVDVPNANTLIIEDADRMGLAQLHQLRGRVGRSPRRAYAYFCYKRNKVLNPDAEKRLQAIKDFTEFGSGFKIAMRDLEIRGAGSILGGEQHGNMEAVGYDMYIKLLNEAVSGLDTEIKEKQECRVDLNISAHIPEKYIESLSDRLDMYKRIAAVKTQEDKEDVIDELIDRFGTPPGIVLGLIDIAFLRNRANEADIYEISRKGNDIVLKATDNCLPIAGKLAEKLGDRVTVKGRDVPYIAVRMNKGQSLTAAAGELAGVL